MSEMASRMTAAGHDRNEVSKSDSCVVLYCCVLCRFNCQITKDLLFFIYGYVAAESASFHWAVGYGKLILTLIE